MREPLACQGLRVKNPSVSVLHVGPSKERKRDSQIHHRCEGVQWGYGMARGMELLFFQALKFQISESVENGHFIRPRNSIPPLSAGLSDMQQIPGKMQLKKRQGVPEMGTKPLKALRGCRASNLRGPAAILFISRDACSDSIAKLFRACFYGISHTYRAIRCKMGYRTSVPV